MLDPNAAEISQWKTTGATAGDIDACGGRLQSWTWFAIDEQPVALCVVDGVERDWHVRTAEPLGPADDALVAAHAGTARGLLVSLLDAMARGVPLIMAVAESEFRAGSPLFALVDFARRTLPGNLRRRVRIRCFARNLRRYLEEFQADLTVIPAALLPDAIQLRRDAVMVDGTGARINVMEERHTDYGRFVCERLVQDPSTFAAFVERLNRFIPDLPNGPQTNLIPRLGELTRRVANLEMPAGIEAVDVDWRAAIEPGDLDLFTTESVYRMALHLAPLRDDALAEVERRPAAPAWNWDEEVRRDPQPAIDVLLAARQWEDWRARTQCDQRSLRRAAIGWCASRHWSRHEAFLEDWVAVMRDLGPAPPAMPYPRIAYFEERQAADVEPRVGSIVHFGAPASGANQAPRRALLLDRTRVPMFVAYPQSEIVVKPGQVLLVPASAAAESRLEQFVNDLMLLTPDDRRTLCESLP